MIIGGRGEIFYRGANAPLRLPAEPRKEEASLSIGRKEGRSPSYITISPSPRYIGERGIKGVRLIKQSHTEGLTVQAIRYA
jgi:hypothetical protein